VPERRQPDRDLALDLHLRPSVGGFVLGFGQHHGLVRRRQLERLRGERAQLVAQRGRDGEAEQFVGEGVLVGRQPPAPGAIGNPVGGLERGNVLFPQRVQVAGTVHDRVPEDDLRRVAAAAAGRQHGQRGAQARAQPDDAPRGGQPVQLFVRGADVAAPAFEVAVGVVAGRIAGAVAVEAQHRHAGTGEPVGKHPEQPVGSDHLLPERRTDQDCEVALALGWMEEPEQAALRRTEEHRGHA